MSLKGGQLALPVEEALQVTLISNLLASSVTALANNANQPIKKFRIPQIT
jgi:hypothetical protein